MNHNSSTNSNPLDNPFFKFYIAQKNSLFEKFDCNNKIVFIGDSITDGCEWNELLGRNDIANRGINADTTAGVLSRLDSYLKQKPKGIFIMIGGNDINRSVGMDMITSNYLKIIKKIKKNGTPLVVQSTLYNNFFNRDIFNAKVKILNDFLITQCNLLSIPYINLNGQLSNSHYLLKCYSNDGIHLNGDGYMVWKNNIMPYIIKISRDDQQGIVTK